MRHGRYSTYQRLGCRCQPCKDDYFRYMKGLKYDHANGIHRNVDSGPARERVMGLIARGWTHAQIAATAGVWHTTVTRLVNHPEVGAHRDTVAALLAVRLDQKPAIEAGMQDATGSARRLQALSWLGWTWPAVAARTGLDLASIARIAADHPRRGDAFEAWLKARRDATTTWTPWHALDDILDRYRLHADTGTPLDEHVCEGQAVGDCECLEQPAEVQS